MHHAFAILFSLLLMWTQAVSAALSVASAKAPCDGCDCSVMSCCPAQGSETPATVPAGRDRVQTQFQLLAGPIVLFVLPENEAPAAHSVDLLHIASSPRVPLFARDCAYLI